MKSISKDFGFWLLVAMSFFFETESMTTEAVICLVGSLLFDAIKSLDKQSDNTVPIQSEPQ